MIRWDGKGEHISGDRTMALSQIYLSQLHWEKREETNLAGEEVLGQEVIGLNLVVFLKYLAMELTFM